jgi:hypothetical protein
LAKSNPEQSGNVEHVSRKQHEHGERNATHFVPLSRERECRDSRSPMPCRSSDAFGSGYLFPPRLSFEFLDSLPYLAKSGL